MIQTTMLSLFVLGQVVLTGSTLSPEQAQEKARLIVVAEPVRYFLLGSGAIAFGQVDLRHSAILKGEVKEEVLERASMAVSGPEAPPRKDEEYIFFINDYKNHLNILKILPKTEDNVAAVRKGIKAKRKP